MNRWLLQLAFGVTLGVSVRAAIPAHHSAGYAMAALLSLLGAAGGGFAAQTVLPRDALRTGGFLLAGMGAIAMLLIHALLA